MISVHTVNHFPLITESRIVNGQFKTLPTLFNELLAYLMLHMYHVLKTPQKLITDAFSSSKMKTDS
jgi:hypothetical protein